MLAGEQAAQFELVELLGDRRDRRLDLGLLRLVVDLAGQLVQHLGVVELLRQLVVHVDVGFDVGVVGVDLLGALGVVPQVGAADLGFELDQPVAALGDLQVLGRLVETATDVAQVVGEVTHPLTRCSGSAVALLELLARPARARARCAASSRTRP